MPPTETLSITDAYMPPELSPEMRDIVISIRATSLLEERLPLLNSIKEIEAERVHTMRLARWAEARSGTPSAGEFYNWAVRVGMMCHRRVQQLLKGQKASLPEKDVLDNAPVPDPPFTSPPPNPEISSPTVKPAKSENREAEILKVMEEIRKEAKSKGLDEKIIRQRARDRLYHRLRRSLRKKKRAENSPRKHESPSDHFRSYWVKEKKLLATFFPVADLAVIAEYWWREFHAYRAEEEKILSDHRQERERRKALAALAKP